MILEPNFLALKKQFDKKLHRILGPEIIIIILGLKDVRIL